MSNKDLLDDEAYLKNWSEEEIKKMGRLERSIGDHWERVVHGQRALVLAAGLQVFTLIIAFIFEQYNMDLVIEVCIIAAIYVGLAVAAKRYPITALIAGFVVYTAIIILYAAIQPNTLFKGIIWKLIIFYLLVRGINAAFEVRRIKNTLKDFSNNN